MPEQVVLVDDSGQPIGKAPKATVHSSDTPLHLAFSCYVFNPKGRFLLTQRALSKKVWPGVWTNSVCGHPAPGETMIDAIKRRLDFELGIKKVHEIKVVLAGYRYRTPPFKGIIENEICPVYIAAVSADPQPNPEEVEDYKWVDWDKLMADIKSKPRVYSYWFKDQLKQLPNLAV